MICIGLRKQLPTRWSKEEGREAKVKAESVGNCLDEDLAFQNKVAIRGAEHDDL